MTERRAMTTTFKLAVMVKQARCPLCHERLGSLTEVDFDHSTPLALGGADDETNVVAVHRSCHRMKTSGTQATSAGSDIHAIAKSKRLTKAQEEFRARMLAKGEPDEQPRNRNWRKWR